MLHRNLTHVQATPRLPLIDGSIMVSGFPTLVTCSDCHMF